MLPRHGAESDLSVQHLPWEISAGPLDHSSGQVMARSSQLAVPQGEPGSGMEQQHRNREQWVLPSKVPMK